MWKNKGFTLIELLVTIALMAVLMAGTFGLIGQGPRMSARDSQRQTSLGTISSSLEMYRNDNQTYPPCPGAASSCDATTIAGAPAFSGYLAVPADPRPGRIFRYAPRDAGNGACAGTAADRCVRYSICAGSERDTVTNNNAQCGAAACGGTNNCVFVVRNP